MDSTLERSIFDTIRYFDIFALPVTAVQIWRALVVDDAASGVRWGGHLVPSLQQVRHTLASSVWLNEHIASRWGYFCLRSSTSGRERDVNQLVRQRLAHHVLAQHKWKIVRRVALILARLPLVRMIGVTGSLALSNTRRESDLDLLIVVRSGRVWTARILLLLAAQLMGRRRKYWDQRAPDKVCLNHYITDRGLTMAPAIRSIYTAMLYTHVVPLAGLAVFKRWRLANESWLKRWLMYPEPVLLPPRQYVALGRTWRMLKGWAEELLQEPIGRFIEKHAEQVQRRTIAHHSQPRRLGQPQRWGRIVLSDDELAFHPDSKEPMVLRRFAEEYGQGRLL